MELGFTLLDPVSGARADVVLAAPEGTGLSEVTAELVSRVLPAGRPARLTLAGACLPPGSPLGVPPLVHGALLHVESEDRPTGPLGPGPEPVTALRLVVVGGPDAGAVHRLAPGRQTVGRSATSAVVLLDRDVSRRHCHLDVDADGVIVSDAGSSNGTTVDGEAVSGPGCALTTGAVLRIGRSSLVVVTDEPPAAVARATGDGRRSVNRPPRLSTPHRPVQVVVPAPPDARDRTPVPVLAVLAPLVLGVALWRVTGSAVFLLFTLLSPVLVISGVVTERRTGRKSQRRERALWRARRDVAEATLSTAVRQDEGARRDEAPHAVEATWTATGPGPRLWERRAGDEDRLALRLGLADQPARVEAEGDVPDGATTARGVPVVVPLLSAGVLGVAGPRVAALGLARWLVVQAAGWHSPRDLSLVVLAEPSAAADWEWCGWLPHTRPRDGQDCSALLGLSTGQAAARVRELRALVDRRTSRDGPRGPVATDDVVLVMMDGALALRGTPGLAEVLAAGPAVGVHAVCLATDPGLLPEECGVAAVLSGEAALDVRRRDGPDLLDATADLLGPGRATTVARALAALRDDTLGPGGSLPTSVRWTELVDLPLTGGERDVDRVLERWAVPSRTPTAVIGQAADGPFAIDLAADGPHALVAGTTGSGKSELLQTLVASLAAGQRPDELSFVLVDYKGGAAFGPCARLPHTVGLVTDLDPALVERALTSLGAELTRRERVLAASGAKDLDEHRRLLWRPRSGAGPAVVGPPLARLVLVVDEFASLAEELPDFVGGLVGIAMRGRSLGVHLVLATQRPEGVVSQDIRANTNLRLCLAVPRDVESRDVLDSPVAAAISRTTPGRGYVRTGHGELTAFQAGRIGGRRAPVARSADRPTVALLPAALLGDPVDRTPRVASRPDETSDLSLLVQACAEAARRLDLPATGSPWLPPLPKLLLRADLPVEPDPLCGAPGRVPPLAYGLLDVPSQQARRALALDLDRSGHLLVLGSPRSGRTTALRAVAGAIAAGAHPDDVHLYALDLGGGGLAPLTALPHTGAVVSADQPERVERLLTWLTDELARRHALLSAGGHADLAGQRAADGPGDRLPHLVLLLDRWEGFLSAFQDVDAGRWVDVVLRLLQEGLSVGLHVVVSADRSGLVGRLGSLVGERLLLRMADRGDYASAGLPSRTVPATLPPGRGWSLRDDPLVAQVALLAAETSGPGQAEALRQLADAAPRSGPGRGPRRFDPLPTVVHRSTLTARAAPGFLLLGAGGDDVGPLSMSLVDAASGLLVAGAPGSGRSTTLLTLAAGLRSLGLTVVAVAPRPSPLRSVAGCLEDPDRPEMLEERLAGSRVALLIDDAELLLDSALAPVLERAVRQARDTGTVVVAAGTTDDLLPAYRGFVVDLRRSRAGVLLAPRSAGDGDLFGLRLSRSTGGDAPPGRGLLAVRGRVQPVQVALPT